MALCSMHRALGAVLTAAAVLQGAFAFGSVSRIAFGSCNKADARQDLWDDIVARRPDAWIWAGDNVYGDRLRGIKVDVGGQLKGGKGGIEESQGCGAKG